MTAITVHLRRADGSIADRLAQFDELTVVDRWRDVGRWTLVTSDPQVVTFFADRAVGVVVKRGETVIMSGPVDYARREYRGGTTTLTVGGPDDTTHLAGTLAWPKPTAAIGSQDDAYDKRTGPAEDMIVDYCRANLVTRLGLPITIGASQGRGSSRTYRARFQTLLEVCQSVASVNAWLGFRLAQQSDRTIGLEVWVASDLTSQGALLSDETGTTLDWAYSEQWPTATRVVVAGGDEKADRLFRLRSDTSAESTWDRIVEVLQDRRDVDPADATAAAELDDAGDETLTEQSAAISLRLMVADAPGVEYGTDYRIGDLVRAYPSGVQVDDRITEATLTVTRDGGEQVQVWVGPKDDDPDERVERRARMFDRRLRQLERSY